MPTTQHSALITHHSSLITIEGLSFQYDGADEPTLRNVNLSIARGELVLLLGPSGAGKSTLALCLNGLIPQQIDSTISGRILVDGLDTQQARVADLCQKVGLVFQDADSQLALLKVGDEVAFGPENLRLPQDEIAARVHDALAAVGLDGQEEREHSTLSGGNKQRLALAAMLALRPQLLVFDEPTANLDPQATSHFFALCGGLRAAGATILIIEHKLDELIGLVDRVAVMNPNGEIELCAPSAVVFADPAVAARLEQYGIWLPQVTELAHRLPALAATRYPLTIAEAVAPIAALAQAKGLCSEDAERLQPAPTAGANNGSPLQSNPLMPHASCLITDLSYRYPGRDGVEALSGVNLSVMEGEFFAIVGPNGSGKSTLAAHLVGLIKPQRGCVTVLGRDVADLKGAEVAKLIGYVFQNPEHQFVARTVYDELAFGLRALKMDEGEVKRRVDKALAEFGLVGMEGRNPFSLSQGQKRRLSVATMLVVGQRVLILDEPTFGQDEANAAALMQRLEELQRRGITIIMITHDLRLVAEYAARVAVMQAGRIPFVGKPAELFANATLMQDASLVPPTLYTLSQLVREHCPSFPLLVSLQEYVDYLS
ncbi:MAG: ABC transporter ATP-binding protein [Candidatus Chloroheliales bacterium]|nr:MAG: ABC transporter ATP-binding protein [Chloroflexota bacterium]